MEADYQYAGLYDLRLKVSQNNRLFRLPEFLYTEMETDTRRSGEKIFDYVDPKNRDVQVEMEQACTAHLKDIGGWLAPSFDPIAFDEGDFPVEASVVIPVRNRAKTIEDAVRSVLDQQTSFSFNLIVVDNHSTDGTSDILGKLASEDSRLIHLVPERTDLGIGGCWNMAISHEQCGKFAVQLDSDDLYAGDDTLQTIVNAFYEQNCAMVIGSYRMVNFQLEEIPPGIIDHKEWTPENGRNNALRINGLGAPRAFYTPVLRCIRVPNVSYGEDYAVGLSISRNYQIGRIYDPIYMVRRWEDNSDASLDVVKMNNHNFYKDRVRTMELWARIAKNRQ
jgi:glycosyltransferase involved in cell wall biosynthesis